MSNSDCFSAHNTYDGVSSTEVPNYCTYLGPYSTALTWEMYAESALYGCSPYRMK